MTGILVESVSIARLLPFHVRGRQAHCRRFWALICFIKPVKPRNMNHHFDSHLSSYNDAESSTTNGLGVDGVSSYSSPNLHVRGLWTPFVRTGSARASRCWASLRLGLVDFSSAVR